jgi:hypothetical protein
MQPSLSTALSHDHADELQKKAEEKAEKAQEGRPGNINFK